ncbi:MAG TPA: DUF2996 domain-containing protein [Leptolyngbyaceae cyanobacterium]|jgi:hypothetical protein
MAEKTNPNPNTKDPTSGPPNPDAGESRTPDASKELAPSTDEPQATSMPSANAPDPEAANPEVNPNATGEKPTTETAAGDTNTQTDADVTAQSAEQQADDKPAAKKPARQPAGDKPAAKAKKEKAPAVEDKPFTEFIEQDYLPALKSAFAKQGIEDVEVIFTKDKIQISGLSQTDECWQVAGSWKNGQRQFNIYFPGEDINKQKAFSWATNGAKPSTLESFMIDERKVTLDLIVFYTMQRLNAQKWLARN